MSRIGKLPVVIPQGVEVKVEGGKVHVKGPKGALAKDFHPRITVTVADGKVAVGRASDAAADKALHGLVRSVINNLVEGVTKGYKKSLEIVGTGFRAKVEGNLLDLALGYSHPIKFAIPAGIKIEVEKNVMVHVSGIDKELVGKVASEIRKFYLPEPYKGKGVRYLGEHVRRKAGKTVA
ncbi:MAG TPA: 50S ribosomal protein L6 [bacterium]|nr:50S ribosomal protein L6 [bacterium]